MHRRNLIGILITCLLWAAFLKQMMERFSPNNDLLLLSLFDHLVSAICMILLLGMAVTATMITWPCCDGILLRQLRIYLSQQHYHVICGERKDYFTRILALVASTMPYYY